MDDPRFEGRTAKEAEDFVTAVKKIALNQGKHRDLEWTAAFASSCFYGPALRWLEGFDDELQSDWKLLRQAILQQWPAETQSGGSSLQTSAAAPPPPTGRTATVLSAPVKSLSLFKCIYCKAHYRPVEEEFCSTQCRDSASGVAPLLIELEPTDPLHIEVNTLFDIDWIHTTERRVSVKRIFRIVMKPSLMESYYAYRRAVEERGDFVSKCLKAGNERRIWALVGARGCNIGDGPAAAMPCGTAECDLCKIIRDSFELPKGGFGWRNLYGTAIRGTTVSSKADKYSENRSSIQTNQNALLLASVVMGKVSAGYVGPKSLPAGFQSVTIEPGPDTTVNYNDTVVYNKNAIRPEFLVMYERQ